MSIKGTEQAEAFVWHFQDYKGLKMKKGFQLKLKILFSLSHKQPNELMTLNLSD